MAPKELHNKNGACRGGFSVGHLVKIPDAIVIAVVQVAPEDATATEQQDDLHAIVWDAWRRILFLGPGNFDEGQTDGAIEVHDEDIADEKHVNADAGCTLTEYVRNHYYVHHIVHAQALMINKKRLDRAAAEHHIFDIAGGERACCRWCFGALAR